MLNPIQPDVHLSLERLATQIITAKAVDFFSDFNELPRLVGESCL